MTKYLIIFFVLTNFRLCIGTVLIGTRAQDGQFPWLIQFHTIAPCGGVLVSPDWVLTAAQCVQYKRNSIVLYANGLNGTGTNQTVNVKATYIYHQFQAYSKSRDYDNNIALLKLVHAFDMCDSKVRLLDIAPVRLDDDYKSCLIFGWQGIIGPLSKVHAKPVQYSKVLLNSWRICTYMYKGNVSYRNVFCTMVDDENGIRACAGNPGSPVVCEDQYQRMVLLGIASWSNFSLDCGGLPTYLGVSVFRSWMWDLIFGNKNLDQWETGIENGAGACQKERRLGGIYDENNLHLKNYNYTEKTINHRKNENEENYEDYDAFSISSKLRKNNVEKNLKKNFKNNEKILKIDDKLKPPFFENFDDYTRILDTDDSRKKSNFDIIQERDKQLSEYREIGRNSDRHHRDDIDEPITVQSRREKFIHLTDKKMNKFEEKIDQDIAESFDDLELVMPNGIEDFSRSDATIIFFLSIHCKFIFMIILFISMTIQRFY